MITKLKHGARGRFSDIQAERKRHERRQEKAVMEELMKRREVVRVGPLRD